MHDIDTLALPARVNLRNLAVASYVNGITHWHYRATTLSDVLAPDFFDDATHIRRGDHISVSAFDGGALLYMGRAGVKVMAKVDDQ